MCIHSLCVLSLLQLLGDLPSPIPEEPSHMGTPPTSPQTPRPHPTAERSLEAKAARHLAAALHHSRLQKPLHLVHQCPSHVMIKPLYVHMQCRRVSTSSMSDSSVQSDGHLRARLCVTRSKHDLVLSMTALHSVVY